MQSDNIKNPLKEVDERQKWFGTYDVRSDLFKMGAFGKSFLCESHIAANK